MKHPKPLICVVFDVFGYLSIAVAAASVFSILTSHLTVITALPRLVGVVLGALGGVFWLWLSAYMARQHK